MLRIEPTAVRSGIATAGSVPKTNSRMISAPMPPISVSPRTEGPFPPFCDAASIGSRPVTCAWAPAGRCARSALRVTSEPSLKSKPGVPTRNTYAKAVWRSCERYIGFPVVKYELVRAPGLTRAAAANAAATPFDLVTSPGTVTTATSGGASPLPNVFRARWFAS